MSVDESLIASLSSLRKNGTKALPDKRVVIYTCATNGYSLVPQIPPSIRALFDFVCFTDDHDYEPPSGWVVIHLNFSLANPRLTAKALKVLPHFVFPDYRYTLWVDANLGLLEGAPVYIDSFLNSGAEIGLAKHNRRSCIYDEALECMRWGKDKSERIELQVNTYRRAGYPENAGLYQGGFIMRQQNAKVCKLAMEDWWGQIVKHSIRDQISLPVIISRNELTIYKLETTDFVLAVEKIKHKKFTMYHTGFSVRDRLRAFIASLIYRVR
ncbi:glycosyltransferase domain-containing protein [Candidatus Marimicrobium litorale]|uniref:DUF616 domain-containing protein n=1 Tax=Candidatus Marimicrobium litorale TaxID=2518991 RepID=A0ABT3T536_9GAMM|nr:glycosyltransferase domain-containing protein [Candidatus Marimicrobium litorale]MCX2977395.1 DUF616 domain-containing protein [Candidatus Marimicrobium litorale]